jgi:RNA polymerase sigma factor (sigma-70 family)
MSPRPVAPNFRAGGSRHTEVVRIVPYLARGRGPADHGRPPEADTADMAAAAVLHRPRGRLRPRLALAVPDDQLVARVQAGDEAAFEAIYDRYHGHLLAFCRHMLGTREEAEDALQHTFVAAYRALRADEAEVQLRPWLYTIARNRCLSVLRARREERLIDGTEADQRSFDGLAATVQRRDELRDLVDDLQRLPDDQRAALVLFELGGHDQGEIATVLEVRREKVKALVFQAREGLSRARAARQTPCAEIREQLAALDGRPPRRSTMRAHVDRCPSCAAYHRAVGRQRAALAIVLPVAPSLGLKSAVLASVVAGGSGAAVAGGSGAAAGAGAGMVAFAGGGGAGSVGAGAVGASTAAGGLAAAGTSASGVAAGSLAALGAKGVVAKVLTAVAVVGGTGGAASNGARVHEPAVAGARGTARIVNVAPAERVPSSPKLTGGVPSPLTERGPAPQPPVRHPEPPVNASGHPEPAAASTAASAPVPPSSSASPAASTPAAGAQPSAPAFTPAAPAAPATGASPAATGGTAPTSTATTTSTPTSTSGSTSGSTTATPATAPASAPATSSTSPAAPAATGSPAAAPPVSSSTSEPAPAPNPAPASAPAAEPTSTTVAPAPDPAPAVSP